MNEPAIFETPTKTMPLDTVHRIEGDDFAPRTATACRSPQCLRNGEQPGDLRRPAEAVGRTSARS